MSREQENSSDSGERKIDFRIPFPDGSVFVLPKRWEDVFVDTFGFEPARYPEVNERVTFVTGKHVAHRAFPAKGGLDGIYRQGKIGWDVEDTDDALDDPDFYMEHWDDWGPEGRALEDRRITNPPTHAQIAEGVMYQLLRGGILQKRLQRRAEGGAQWHVVDAEGLLRERDASLEAGEGEANDSKKRSRRQRRSDKALSEWAEKFDELRRKVNESDIFGTEEK